MISPSIYSYIKDKESQYDTQEISVGTNWNWSMKTHIQMIFHMKNSQFYTGDNDYMRAFKNIMEPILNLAYWTEDIEVKDVVFYIENKGGRALSFLIKKYHDDKYVKEHDLDQLFDEITEDDVDYGGVLVQKGEKRPEVVFMPAIAFADQTDILGGPLGVKFNFSPSKLRGMADKGWGDESNGATVSIEDLIVLAQETKDPAGKVGQNNNSVTGKNIEVYIVRGDLPSHYLNDDDDMEYWFYQNHVVAFYTDKNGNKEGVTLYRRKGKAEDLQFHTSKKIYSRALGRGVGEGLLHPQIWTNFLEIHKMNMLEAGSKVPLWTDDESYANKNEIQNMENLQITTIAEGRRIGRVPTESPVAVQLFENSVNSWFEQAQAVGSAFDPQMGKEQASGTTFRGLQQTLTQGRGSHDRRRGQRAKFIEHIYRIFIIPDIVKEITAGKKFLATLTSEELQWITEQLAENFANKTRNEAVLEGEIPTDKDLLKGKFIADFTKKGNKHLIEILKDEMKGIEIKMGINIAGKQKNLSQLTDKILSIFEFMFSNPQGFQQVMQIPSMGTAFNDILEFSGISPVDFAGLSNMAPPQQAQPQPQGGRQPINAQALTAPTANTPA